MHYRCTKTHACAECIRQSIHEGLLPLELCGKADVYSQIDMDEYFPQVCRSGVECLLSAVICFCILTIILTFSSQHKHHANDTSSLLFSTITRQHQIELLEEIVEGYPNATYFITFRNIEQWYHSISHWPPPKNDSTLHFYLKDRLLMANHTGLPTGVGNNILEYAEWWCGHVTRVRNLIAKYPSHNLVEIDIEDPSTAEYMSDVFDLDANCWGHANVNANLHKELVENSSNETDSKVKGSMPWFIRGKIYVRGKNGVMRRKRDLPEMPPGMIGPFDGRNTTLLRMVSKQLNVIDIAEQKNKTGEAVKEVDDQVDKQIDAATHNSFSSERVSLDNNCKTLLSHAQGYWKHHPYNSTLLNDATMRRLFFPKEKDWIRGRHLSVDFRTCTASKNVLMYNGIVGHQCGCGVRGFQPSLSEWVHDAKSKRSMPTFSTASLPNATTTTTLPTSWSEYYENSATLRLVRQLANANATLCFAGDSIDYQIFHAMKNNLLRIDQLHNMHHPENLRLLTVRYRDFPINHTTKPGTTDDWYLLGRRPPDGDGSFLNGRRPPAGGHGSMISILETKAYFRDSIDDQNKMARIRYFMTYGWSPWNLEFMESCNVIVMNGMGLHYDNSGDHIGRETRHPLKDDMRAAITYLANFTSAKENRISVWRGALPQHFDTADGNFHGWKNLPKDHTCSPLKQNSSGSKHNGQIYNRVYDEVFESMCQGSGERQPSCYHLTHTCSVNVTETSYQTRYKVSANSCGIG